MCRYLPKTSWSRTNEVLPANGRKTFKKIKAGYLNAIPQEVRIDIVTAVPFSQR